MAPDTHTWHKSRAPGFLTEFELDNMYEGLEKIKRGEYKVEERLMLEAVVVKNNMITDNFRALNDIVISRVPSQGL